MDQKKNLDNHLRKQAASLEISPQLGSFDAIMLKLKRKRKKRALWIFTAAGIMLFATFPFLLDRDPNVNIKPVEEKRATQKQNSSTYKNSTKLSPANAVVSSQEKLTELTNSSTTANRSNSKTYTSPQHPQQNSTGANTYEISKSKENAVLSIETEKEPATDPEVILSDTTINQLAVEEKLDATFRDTVAKTVVIDSLKPESVVSIQPAFSNSTSPKNYLFFAGIGVEPQLNDFMVQSNSNYSDRDFSEAFSQHKRENTPVKVSYAFGLKLGVLIKNKWEVIASLGYQRLNAPNEIPYNPGTVKGIMPNSGPGTQGVAYNTASFDQSTIQQQFNYFSFSAGLSRIIDLPRFTRVKLGGGLSFNQLHKANALLMVSSNMYDNFSNSKNSLLRKQTTTLNIKVGILEDLGRRFQFHFCPTLFYSPSSLFQNDYVIKQRPFGLGLECMLLMKLSKN